MNTTRPRMINYGFYLTRVVRLLIFSTIPISFWLINSHFATAQSSTVTYHNPLAYVGTDGNYYVTSLDRTSATAVTANMALDPADYSAEANHYGSRPHWSPQGTHFAFINQGFVYIAESGEQTKLLASNAVSSISGLAWSPDGKQLAYRQGNNIQIIKPDGTQVKNIVIISKRNGGGGSGSGPGPEHAYRILQEEREQYFGLPEGGVFFISNSGYLTRLQNAGLVSPDGTRMLITEDIPSEIDNEEWTIRPILNDLATGSFLSLPSSMGIGSEPLTWTPDGKSIIYATKTLVKKIGFGEKGSTLSQCQEHYDYMLTLWRQGFD
jgi:hypothetical protein